MRKDKLNNLNNQKKEEGVFPINNNKFVVRLKLKKNISSIKKFNTQKEAQEFFNDCKSGKITIDKTSF